MAAQTEATVLRPSVRPIILPCPKLKNDAF